MPSFQDSISQGAVHAWLFMPTAIILGALHGLEPGHSKTMMAAFIIAIRGTIAQAVLLGLSAAISHSLVIWLLAALALRLGSHWNAETTQPYFQLASGIIIVGLAVWMFWRTRRDVAIGAAHSHEHHEHAPHGGQWMETLDGFVEVSVFEKDAPPRFRLHFYDKDKNPVTPQCAEGVVLETLRSDGSRQSFTFISREDCLEAGDKLPEPHEFEGKLRVPHGPARGDYEFTVYEDLHHHAALDVSDGSYQDAHERAHAADIARRFPNRRVTTGQIVLFGLTGGLLPCPAALTVLLVCLQLKQFTLGFALVICFSIGLALTMISVGAAAAWSVQHASRRIKGFGEFARRAPYVSSVVLAVLGVCVTCLGWSHLSK